VRPHRRPSPQVRVAVWGRAARARQPEALLLRDLKTSHHTTTLRLEQDVSFLIQNCNGLGSDPKRQHLARRLKQVDFALLQETHLTDPSIKKFPSMSRFRNNTLAAYNTRSRGTVVSARKKIPLQDILRWEGRIAAATAPLSPDQDVLLVSVYAPNTNGSKDVY
jgi:exonuclease III